ncbi:MAG: glycosyltransferase [Clostridia bacterium]|nr:glycosyltransferase [Clostridia bacterium]
MKILWLCNTLLSNASEKLNIQHSKPESWINGFYNNIKKLDNVKLLYLFPWNNSNLTTNIDNTKFISYTQKNVYKFENIQIDEFKKILKKTNPDIIHIFGTEYSHSLAMLKAAQSLNMLDRTVVNLQGICFTLAKHYLEGLDLKTVHSYTFRDFLRHNNIYNQMLDFKKRAEFETEAIKLTHNVIGRTDWDEACAKRVNPDVNYYFCNETLRKPFYENEWDIEKCERKSIFVSQCSYPIKGFHYMLEAMADIVKAHPDAHLYTTGAHPLKLSLRGKIRQNSYNRYIGKLIKKYKLQNNVSFLGYLKENEMCERFLKSHVFVCSSTVENESNALSEAKILGVPSVVSFAGGMTNRIEHKKDGFLYPINAPYMLAFYIKKIFEDDNLALSFSKASKQAAKKVNDIETNFQRLMEIYTTICDKN